MSIFFLLVLTTSEFCSCLFLFSSKVILVLVLARWGVVNRSGFILACLDLGILLADLVSPKSTTFNIFTSFLSSRDSSCHVLSTFLVSFPMLLLLSVDVVLVGNELAGVHLLGEWVVGKVGFSGGIGFPFWLTVPLGWLLSGLWSGIHLLGEWWVGKVGSSGGFGFGFSCWLTLPLVWLLCEL